MRIAKHSEIALGARVARAASMLAAAWLFACGQQSADLPVYWSAPEFALVDQRGDTLRNDDLDGTVWVASFIFTNCTSVCPAITAKMAQLRDALDASGRAGGDVRLVSITVDPARDTPEVLSEYAERYGGAAPERWAFLTGTPPDDVRRLIQEGFRLSAVLDPMAAHEHANYQVQHSPRVVLVDRDGVVRGTYTATEPDAYDQLLADVNALME